MNDDWQPWCHDCDQAAANFYAHANAGHAVINGRCPGNCQFTARRAS